MGQVSYKDFRTRIRRRIWVSPGEPRNLVSTHDEMFKQAMIEIGKWVEILQVNNTSVFKACSTYVQCAKTLTDAPAGVIRRVYTIANDVWCDPVSYWREDFQRLECMARNLITNWVAPENRGLPALQQGVRLAEASTDINPGTDNVYGRARIGVWAVYRKRLYLFPWLQSNESLVVEWDGFKTDWTDDDVLDEDYWTPDVEAAIETFVRWKHEQNFGAPDRAATFKREFYGDAMNPGGQLGDLIYWSKKQIEQQESIEPCASPRVPTTAEVEDDATPAVTPDSAFAIIGDYGKPTNGTAELDVATMVKGWDDGEKFFIVTAGDNIYTPTTSYEEAVTPFYGDYITDDLTTNRFWPALGNHDYNDPIGGLDAYQEYFTLPNNERYYDFVKGATHFFILNSSLQTLGAQPPDPDGLSVTSKQALWLKAKLALSTAKWKIVVVQDPPYTLHPADYPGHAILRYPFKDWGADVVVSGDFHAYERYEVSGFPYIVCGCGGATLEGSFHADGGNVVTPFNKFKQLGTYGAIRGTATCTELVLQFRGLGDVVVDELKLTKAA